MSHPVIQQGIHRIVYSSEDLIVIRGALQQVFLPAQSIPVSMDGSVSELLTFVSMERYNKGLLLTYEQGLSLHALYNGLIIFTGHMKFTGKTITVLYSEGTTVTYGFVDELSMLPYAMVNRGDEIGQKKQGKLYIQVERDGVLLKMDDILLWMKEQVS